MAEEGDGRKKRRMEEMKMSMYENLVMQTQMNYSKYYGRYAA